MASKNIQEIQKNYPLFYRILTHAGGQVRVFGQGQDGSDNEMSNLSRAFIELLLPSETARHTVEFLRNKREYSWTFIDHKNDSVDDNLDLLPLLKLDADGVSLPTRANGNPFAYRLDNGSVGLGFNFVKGGALGGFLGIGQGPYYYLPDRADNVPLARLRKSEIRKKYKNMATLRVYSNDYNTVFNHIVESLEEALRYATSDRKRGRASTRYDEDDDSSSIDWSSGDEGDDDSSSNDGQSGIYPTLDDLPSFRGGPPPPPPPPPMSFGRSEDSRRGSFNANTMLYPSASSFKANKSIDGLSGLGMALAGLNLNEEDDEGAPVWARFDRKRQQMQGERYPTAEVEWRKPRKPAYKSRTVSSKSRSQRKR
jgi:hypothetical protein